MKQQKKRPKTVTKSALRQFCQAAQAVGLLDLNKALVLSARKGQADVVQVLLDGGADVHFGADTALWNASACGHTETARVLLVNGANINPHCDGYSEGGRTSPLFAAACAGQEKTVKFLLESGADVHVENDLPLVCAAQYYWPRVVQALLDGGADVHARNDFAVKAALGVARVNSVSKWRSSATQKDIKDTLTVLRAAGAIVPVNYL